MPFIEVKIGNSFNNFAFFNKFYLYTPLKTCKQAILTYNFEKNIFRGCKFYECNTPLMVYL